MRTDEELVVAARTGEPDAFGPLVERWTGRCWDIAWRILHDRDLAADVAQETLLTAWQQLDRLDKPASFGGWVSRIARNRALDRLERERRAMATDDDLLLERAAAGAVGGDGASAVGDPVAELDSAQRQELVWAAAAALGERDASVLDLHLRHGLEPRELADELGIAPNNAHQVLFRLRKRLGAAIRAWLLWRGGHPRCDRLAADLASAGVEVFGAAAVTVIDEHADACVACDRQRAQMVAPAAMFASVPIAVMPAALVAQVLAGLRDAGVPVPVDAGGIATPGEAAEAAGAGDPAETGGAAEPAGSVVAGDPAATGGAGSADPAGASPADPAGAADGDASGSDAPGGAPGQDAAPGAAGQGAGTATKILSGIGASFVVVLVLLVLFVGGSPPSEPAALAPDPAPPTEPAPPSEPDDLEVPGEDPVEVAPLPPVPGNHEDPAVVPVVPPVPWGPPEPVGDELGGSDDGAGAPADTDPPVAPPAPDDGDPDTNGSDDGDDEGGEDGNGDGDGDGDDGDDGDDGEDEAEEPLIHRFTAQAARGEHECTDGFPARVSWITEHAHTVELTTGTGTTIPGVPLQASGHAVCIDSSTLTLTATGEGGTTSETAVLQ